jgi:hypothetical protein
MKKYVITVCLVAWLLPSCKPKPEVNDESNTDSLSILSDGGLYNDSLVLSRPAIVFFQPGEVQIDSMLGSDPNAGIADANSDFIYYSGLATDSLRNTDSIAVMYTNKRFIYSPLSGGSHHLTDRQQDKLIFGMLITDGQRSPLIINGVKTDQEYIREALNYLKK